MSARPTDPEAIPLHLHIPKCAGTTLSNCVYQIYRSRVYSTKENGLLVDGIYYYPNGFHREDVWVSPKAVEQALRRDDLRAVTGHFSFGIHESLSRPGYYFTVLRKPLERVVSLYYHLKRWPRCRLHAVANSEDMTLERFVRDSICLEVDNDQTRRISGVDAPFGKCGPAILEQAKENLAHHFPVAGITERFDESLILFKHVLGWDHVPVFSRSLVNEQRPRLSGLEPGALSAIEEHNQLDEELYRFAVGIMDQKIQSLGDCFANDLSGFRKLNERGENTPSASLTPTGASNARPSNHESIAIQPAP